MFQSSVSECQIPHKIINLLLTITNWNIKLTVLWRSRLSESTWWIHYVGWNLTAPASHHARPPPGMHSRYKSCSKLCTRIKNSGGISHRDTWRVPPLRSFQLPRPSGPACGVWGLGPASERRGKKIFYRTLVHLVIFDSGWVSLEHLLLSWYPSQPTLCLACSLCIHHTLLS